MAPAALRPAVPLKNHFHSAPHAHTRTRPRAHSRLASPHGFGHVRATKLLSEHIMSMAVRLCAAQIYFIYSAGKFIYFLVFPERRSPFFGRAARARRRALTFRQINDFLLARCFSLALLSFFLFFCVLRFRFIPFSAAEPWPAMCTCTLRLALIFKAKREANTRIYMRCDIRLTKIYTKERTARALTLARAGPDVSGTALTLPALDAVPQPLKAIYFATRSENGSYGKFSDSERAKR